MKILFMCVANSARSQMAEGWARQMFPEAEVRSAGSAPSHLNPFAVAAMREVGIDISTQFSKTVDELPLSFTVNLDFIITLCAEEQCPTMVAPHARRLHWPVPDPASSEKLSDEEMRRRFAAARDQIHEKLKAWKAAEPLS